jgi:hypothetical protein
VPLAAVAARRGPGAARASRGLLRDGHRTRHRGRAAPRALLQLHEPLEGVLSDEGARTTFDQAQHGLKERLREPRRELVDAYLVADPTSPNTAQNFDELLAALAGAPLAARTNYDLPALLPQILSGHRLRAQAAGKVERRLAAKSKTPAFCKASPTRLQEYSIEAEQRRTAESVLYVTQHKVSKLLCRRCVRRFANSVNIG